MTDDDPHSPGVLGRLRRALFGAPRDVQDPGIFHKMALIPFLAWIGLGSDGLSSSSYGPDEAFRNLGSHQYLALFLCVAFTHVVLIVGGIATHAGRASEVVHHVSSGMHAGLRTVGVGGLLLLFLRAYSMGGGTYTGIEAVSNGLQIMREPRVQ